MTHQWWSWSSSAWIPRRFTSPTLLLGFRWSRKWTTKTVGSAEYQSSCQNRETTFTCCLWWSGNSCSWRRSRNVSKWYQHGVFNYAIKPHPWPHTVSQTADWCNYEKGHQNAYAMWYHELQSCHEINVTWSSCTAEIVHDCSSNHINSREDILNNEMN